MSQHNYYQLIYDNEYSSITFTSKKEINDRLICLKKYLSYERKKSMSKSEVRLYEWILKKQHKATNVTLYGDINDSNENYYSNIYHYISYYQNINIYDPEIADKKQQQKYRARHHR